MSKNRFMKKFYAVKVLLNPTDRRKERKLLMILTVALLNGPFIAPLAFSS
jgi:hypothetical protein